VRFLPIIQRNSGRSFFGGKSLFLNKIGILVQRGWVDRIDDEDIVLAFWGELQACLLSNGGEDEVSGEFGQRCRD
jgi:hypothetical protein